MRVTIDATSLLLEGAGVKNYMYYWLAALRQASHSCGAEIAAYPPGLSTEEPIDHRRSATDSIRDQIGLRIVHFMNIRSNPALSLFLRGMDLFHCSQHTSNLPSGLKTSATVFDFSCWTFPETHTPQNIAATKRYAERILKRCDAVIAISAHARQDAVEILRLPQNRIRVVYPGVAEPFFRVTAADVPPVLIRYGLPSSYLLFVGCIEPRKNVRGLLRAYQELPETVRRDVRLVIAGMFGWETDEIRQLMNSPYVQYLGYVPEADLPALFRAAAAFVYPSFYEGFGLPVAQAMAVGVPVITSNRSSLPEVIGDAGLTVNPASTADLATAMYKILSSSSLAKDLSSRGRSRAVTYSWDNCAAASIEFFQAVCSGTSELC